MFYHLIDSPMTIAAIPLDPTGIQHSALVCTQHRCETTVKARAEIQLWKHQAKQFRIISINILYIYIYYSIIIYNAIPSSCLCPPPSQLWGCCASSQVASTKDGQRLLQKAAKWVPSTSSRRCHEWRTGGRDKGGEQPRAELGTATWIYLIGSRVIVVESRMGQISQMLQRSSKCDDVSCISSVYPCFP